MNPGKGNFFLLHSLDIVPGAHPAAYPVGARTLSLGVMRPGRDGDHSPPSNTEVKMMEL
jgi:hypothetical protein